MFSQINRNCTSEHHSTQANKKSEPGRVSLFFLHFFYYFIRNGINVLGEDSIMNVSESVCSLSACDEHSIVSDFLIRRAIDEDAVVMPHGYIDGVSASQFFRRLRSSARTQSRNKTSHNKKRTVISGNMLHGCMFVTLFSCFVVLLFCCLLSQWSRIVSTKQQDNKTTKQPIHNSYFYAGTWHQCQTKHLQRLKSLRKQ